MANKEPKDTDQTRLPVDPVELHDINTDMTKFMAGIRAAREASDGDETASDPGGLDKETARRALRLIKGGGEDQPVSVHEDIGYGDRRAMSIEYKRTVVLGTVTKIELQYNPYAKKDQKMFMLQHGLLAIAKLAASPGHQINGYVKEFFELEEKHNLGGEMRDAAIREYDSLAVLQNAFNFVLANPVTGERDPLLVEQFISENCPSEMWENEELKEMVLEAIQLAYSLIADMSSGNPESVEKFVKKLKYAYIEVALGWKIPRSTARRTPEVARFERHLSNARVSAWSAFTQQVEPSS